MTDEPKITFAELNLDPRIQSAIDAAGYEHPTPIQEQAIPVIKKGGDVTGIAQTGTGKTAAFTLPMMHRLTKGRARARMPRSLILCPTRELAAQVSENFETYGKDLKLNMALLIGGVSFKEQEQKLMRGVDVLIATPGRLIDQFERGKILLTGVEVFTIDEADRMLDMGFIPDIEKICKLLPPRRQTLLFSATMPKEIARLAKTFQKDPIRIEVARESKTAETIAQHVVKLPRGDDKAKRTALRRVIESRDVKNGIVFCNRKREVDIVAKSLQKHGFSAAPIHGDLPQSARTDTLNKFRDGELQLLVASDVAARGLDIPDVGHVFNYSPPPKDEDYVHRIGRTGRAGREGESFTMVGPMDEKSWRGVMMLINTDVAEYMPDGLVEELEDLPSDSEGRRGRGRGERGGRGRDRGEGRGRGRGRRERSERAEREPRAEKPKREERDEARAEDETTTPKSSDKPRKERPKRDYKRKDDDLILDPAPDDIRGFGEDVPAFLK
ncbi:MAG: DEAD/DEAH box helicase [Hyphomonadaceae bacterium]|nr:DEAD/DEAH box helicase [Hyphomonadaceae bacterium]